MGAAGYDRREVMTMDSGKTGLLIASVRKSKNMTQRDVADRLHITSKAVSKWERGLSFPDVGMLEPLAAVLGVTVADLLAGEIVREADPAGKPEGAAARALKAKRRARNALFAACAGLLLTAIAVLSIWGAAIFQRGNPIPYLVAAGKIGEGRPFAQVGSGAGIYISMRGECPELIAFVEADRNVAFVEQMGSAYLFSNGVSQLVVASEIYWGKYTVWQVPQTTLRG